MGAPTSSDRTQLDMIAQGDQQEASGAQTGGVHEASLAVAQFLPAVQFQRDSFQAANRTVRLHVGEFIQLDFTVSVQRSGILGVNLSSPLHLCRICLYYTDSTKRRCAPNGMPARLSSPSR